MKYTRSSLDCFRKEKSTFTFGTCATRLATAAGVEGVAGAAAAAAALLQRGIVEFATKTVR
jgi:hypothetical protein